MKLWAHQEKLIEQVKAEFRQGRKAVCCVMPTGTGKSVSMATMAAAHVTHRGANARVIVYAHRDELVGQLYDTFTNVGLGCGVIQSEPCRPINSHQPVQIASIQTVLARGEFPDGSLHMTDECHHFASDKWSEVPKEIRRRGIPLIGATATPCRADGRGLDDIFDSLVCPITTKEAIALGILVPPVVHHPPKTLGSGQIAADPLEAYLEHAPGRKAVLFATNIPSAEKYRDAFSAAGVKAALVTGKMAALERRSILADYREGKLQVLVNVGIATEGWDDPPTSCVILARSIGSLGLYLQVVGRGLRAADGKTDCVILDLHGTVNRDGFGAPDDDREYSLDGDGIRRKGQKESVPISFCEVCKCVIEGGARICPDCHEERPGMMPPEVVGVKLVRYANKARESTEQRKEYFRKLQGIASEKGYNKWWAVMKWEALYGTKIDRRWLFS